MPNKKTKRKTKTLDPSIPLKNKLQECFCVNMVTGDGTAPTGTGGFAVKGISAGDAYVRAGYKSKGKAAGNNAARLIANDSIQQRIDWLSHQQAQELVRMGVATKEEVCQMLTSIIRAKHSDFLSMSADGVWFHDISKGTLNQPALKKVKTRCITTGNGENSCTKQYDEIELESKIPAIKCLADLLGWNKSPKEENAVNVHKEFLDALLAPSLDRIPTPQTG